MYLLLIVFAFVFGVYSYYKWKFAYWKRKGVPYSQPSIPLGNWSYRDAEYIGFKIKKRYDEFKAKGHKHAGFYFLTLPKYVPIDPEYIKLILATDFRYFVDRGIYFNEKSDPLSAHLFNLESERWRKVRSKLSPSFTAGKVKMMFPTMLDIGRQLKAAVDELFEKSSPIDAKEIFSCFATDVIGSCAFGVRCNSFTNPNNEFRKYGKRTSNSLFKADSLGVLIPFVSAKLARLLDIIMLPSDVTKFFVDLVKETIEYRERSSAVSKDFIQLLIDQKNADDPNERFTVEEMAAQVFIFFFAGFESSSSAMTFCLFELARHPHFQNTVREEMVTVLAKHGGEINYEAITELKYLDQVIDETLRKYPPLSTIPRVCAKDYKIPGTDVTLDRGTEVIVPVIGLHYDPDVYPNPDAFDPERFSDECKKNRHGFTYLPFGAGPKTCLGIRFGFAQIKVALVLLLMDYQFRVNEQTKVPFKMDPTQLVCVAKDEILLDVYKL